MGTINGEYGCSVCQNGRENYTTFKHNDKRLAKKFGTMFQYDYRTEQGELFSCVAKTLEECRRRRDNWLSNH